MSAGFKSLSASSIALGGVSTRQDHSANLPPSLGAAPSDFSVPSPSLSASTGTCLALRILPTDPNSSLGMTGPLYHQDPIRVSRPPTRSRWPTPSTLRRKLAFWVPSSDRSTLTRHSRSSSLSLLPSLVTFKFIFQCCIWYASSAMSSNTGKSIMNQFRYPVTLTFVQFFFVASFCALFMSPLVRFSKFRPPTRAIFHATLPMGAFQVGGHIFSSMAISRIPVSTVHTIKVLTQPSILNPPC